jgi:chromosome segregation ATPase
MPDDAAALMAALAESEAKLQKTEQHARSYVNKLVNQHKEETEKLQRELEESKAQLHKAREGLPNGNATPETHAEWSAEAEKQIAALQAEKMLHQQQAKDYVAKLVSKHKTELERCREEYEQKLQEAQTRQNAVASSVASDGMPGDERHGMQNQLVDAGNEQVQQAGERKTNLQAQLEAAVEQLKESESERQKLQEQLAQRQEQAKSYVKQLVAKQKREMEEATVKATELQEEVDNLRSNAEAHNLAMNAKDEMVHHSRTQLQDAHARLAESEERLAAARKVAEASRVADENCAQDSDAQRHEEVEALKHKVQILQEQAPAPSPLSCAIVVVN